MAGNSEHYTVLARRFRPQTFDEVLGQQHVAVALANAVRGGRVAHAYLFTGARGVGKTSMARILAKALNCPNAEDTNPCNQCEICTAIAGGSDVDVLEIDGASNRGIDDIRTLRSNVNIKPMRSRYKLYIIDEVHALTKDAFNALLKTLEEPPPNVKFVFCTTEPNKVPETILSRCQRFDFSAVTTADIVGRLKQIAEAEQVDVEPAALELVARRATGSMRDSQSLFDQLLAFGGERITPDDVHRLLGTAGDERLLAIVDALLERRRDVVLTELDTAVAEGVQVGELYDQLIDYFRDLMVIAAGAGDVPLIGIGEDRRTELERQAKQWGLSTIVAGLQILAETKNRMFRSSVARALAELGLIRVALLEELEDLSSAIAELRAAHHSGASGSTGRQPAPLSDSTERTRQSAPRSAKPAGSDRESASSPKKKIASNPPPSGDPPETSAAANPQIEFRTGIEAELWAQVVGASNDALRTHFQAASCVAIRGPKHLELSFPKSYSFSKQFCERPETTGRIADIIRKLTGKSVRIDCRVVDDPQRIEPKSTDSAESAHSPQPESINDPFVQQALSLFDATVAKVDRLSGP